MFTWRVRSTVGVRVMARVEVSVGFRNRVMDRARVRVRIRI